MYFTCLNQVEAEIPACSQSLPPFPLNRHSTYCTTMSRCREKVDKIRPTTHQSTKVAYLSSKSTYSYPTPIPFKVCHQPGTAKILVGHNHLSNFQAPGACDPGLALISLCARACLRACDDSTA